MNQAILLIDDDDPLLAELAKALSQKFAPSQAVDVVSWRPKATDPGPDEVFKNYLQRHDIRLVVVDYDLTKGQTGLFGTTFVDWCQERAIPIGDFSRAQTGLLPQEPKLFEIRVPAKTTDESADYIAAAFLGFKHIYESPELDASLSKKRSAAATLAGILGAPDLESEFALYTSPYGGTNSPLLDQLNRLVLTTAAEKKKILGYVVGHLLLNAVLKYPGPILTKEALCAFVATDIAEFDAISPLFVDARYAGPFSELDTFHWTKKVSQQLDGFADAGPISEVETSGELNRTLLERKLARTLSRPVACPRCHGKNGGFLCPITRRTVCERADCSVASNNWIPRGAYACRVERDRYEEWAPIVGA